MLCLSGRSILSYESLNICSELNDTVIEAQLRTRQVPPRLPTEIAIRRYLDSTNRLLILVCCLTLKLVTSLNVLLFLRPLLLIRVFLTICYFLHFLDIYKEKRVKLCKGSVVRSKVPGRVYFLDIHTVILFQKFQVSNI